MNRIYVFLRDNAFDMRACMLFLESFSASCFTHTLQLVSKDSLFLESNIGVLIAKALQTILTLQVFLVSSVSIQKLLLPLQDIKTRSSSTYLILKRLEKLKQVSKTTWLIINLNPKIFLKLMNGNLLASFMNYSNLYIYSNAEVQ